MNDQNSPPWTENTESAAILTDERIVELYAESFNAMVGRLREAPKHVPETVLTFARAIEADLRAALAAVPVSNSMQLREALETLRHWSGNDARRDFIQNVLDSTRPSMEVVSAAPVVLVDRNAVLEEAAKACDRYPASLIGSACAKDIRALKYAVPASPIVPQLAVPQGWKLVPIKPNGAMLEAASKADDEGFEAGRAHGASGREIYDAMLAAAPAVAQPDVPQRPSLRISLRGRLITAAINGEAVTFPASDVEGLLEVFDAAMPPEPDADDVEIQAVQDAPSDEQTLPVCHSALRAEPAGQHDAAREVIIGVLSAHRMVHMYECEDDGALGNSYPLIDHLCLEGGRDIQSGKDEVEAIADAILDALAEQTSSAPGRGCSPTDAQVAAPVSGEEVLSDLVTRESAIKAMKFLSHNNSFGLWVEACNMLTTGEKP